jgi:hypothetical protein
MAKKTLFSLVLLVLFILPLKSAAGPLRPSLVPAEARWVIHLDIARLAETRVKALLYEDSARGIGRSVRMIERVGKIDLLRDLTGVTVIGMGPDDQDTVVAFEGKIDKDHLLTLIELDKSPEKITYGQSTIYDWGSHEYGAFVTDTLTLIGGNIQTIQAVLDAWEGKTKTAVATPLLAKFKSASPAAFMIASMDKVSALTKDEEGSTILKKAGAAFLQIEEEKGVVKISLVLDTDSPETASNLAKVVDGLAAMASMRDEPSSPKIDILKDLKIAQEGNVLRATLEMPADRLSERIGRSLHDFRYFFDN